MDSVMKSKKPKGKEKKAKGGKKVYLPKMPVHPGEELVCDRTAYVMLHEAQTGAPCLSFDTIDQGSSSSISQEFPLELYMVSGTQAEHAHTNKVIVMKMSNLKEFKTGQDDDDDADDSSDDEWDGDDEPVLDTASINHHGAVNRLRCHQFDNCVMAAVWSELGNVSIYDLSRPLSAVNDDSIMEEFTRNEEEVAPTFTFGGYKEQGYALDWSIADPGYLATGDAANDVFVWQPSESSWTVNESPYVGHTASVEDVQWSPYERTVFASCSVDKSLRIWDRRADPAKANMITVEEAHALDVNVIHWNRHEPLIVSGGDDMMINIWDLRKIKDGEPVARFQHHHGAITSVEWHPTDGSVIAASGEDNQITLWDISLEKDDPNEKYNKVPSQLLFIHQGQTDIKELHWSRVYPGVVVSTAVNGFNVFRTISV